MKIKILDYICALLHFFNAAIMFHVSFRDKEFIWFILGTLFIITGIWNAIGLFKKKKLIEEVKRELTRLEKRDNTCSRN
jgi:hypothetical protein